MERKNILIITQGFYPEQSPRAFRATELAKELCRQGHAVTVMAPERPQMEALFEEFPIQFISLGTQKWNIPNLKQFGFIGKLYNKLVNRLLSLFFAFPELEWGVKVNKVFGSNQTKFDALISIAVPYPIHWGVASIWRKQKHNFNVWIADCGDPYCLQQNDTFKPPFYFHWVEKWFMRKADFITVPTSTSYQGYFEEFHDKLRVIPQGFKFSDIKRKEPSPDDKIRFGYGGVFIPGKRDPKQFIDYLCSLPGSVDFEFHIHTRTPQFVEPFLKNDMRIILCPPVDRIALLEKFSQFNFVVNFSNQGLAQTPSKLIDYIIIEKPILNIESNNFNPIVFEQFLIGNYKQKMDIKNGTDYQIENVVSKFLNLIECE